MEELVSGEEAEQRALDLEDVAFWSNSARFDWPPLAELQRRIVHRQETAEGARLEAVKEAARWSHKQQSVIHVTPSFVAHFAIAKRIPIGVKEGPDRGIPGVCNQSIRCNHFFLPLTQLRQRAFVRQLAGSRQGGRRVESSCKFTSCKSEEETHEAHESRRRQPATSGRCAH